MNIKAKMWQDLVDDEPFTRADIITLQDPRNASARDLDQFKYLQDGHEAQLTRQQQEARRDGHVNAAALGSMGDKVLKAKAAVDKARRAREAGADVNHAVAKREAPTVPRAPAPVDRQRKLAPNSAAYTTGKAAASFTSTGLTPETSGERALLTDEEFMLKPRRVKAKGYVKMATNLGDLTIELQTETAPKAVWNFIRLAQKGYYDGVAFHRNIPGFMIQGGDPSGTGKGGLSIWGNNFGDEFDGPLTHNARGIGEPPPPWCPARREGRKRRQGVALPCRLTQQAVSMANKGKNTNSSQFFITYKAAPHLDRKHTIFGRVASGLDVLTKLEAVPTDGSDRPLHKTLIKQLAVLIDPFDEFQSQQREERAREARRAEVLRRGGTDDDRLTWTGKRVRGDGAAPGPEEGRAVGKYLRAAAAAGRADEAGQDVDAWEEPAKKKPRAGGFGDFEGW